MKKYILFISIFVYNILFIKEAIVASPPQTLSDSINFAIHKIDTVSTNLKIMKNNIDTLNFYLMQANSTRNDLSYGQWGLIFLPELMTTIFGLLFLIKFWKTDWGKISILISNGDSSKLSLSKFVLFISGISTVFISITMTSIYCYLLITESNQELKIESLIKIYTLLGIGIIPYGIDKWKELSSERIKAWTSLSGK